MECKTCFLVSKVCFSYNPNKHITYHFMWLFDSKLHETFLGVTIDIKWCETHERSDINTHLHYQAWASTYTHWNIINKSMLHMFQRDVADISKHILYRHVSYVALVHHLCYMLIYEKWCLGSCNASANCKPNTWGVTQSMAVSCRLGSKKLMARRESRS
jgi:hypothetical protein